FSLSYYAPSTTDTYTLSLHDALPILLTYSLIHGIILQFRIRYHDGQIIMGRSEFPRFIIIYIQLQEYPSIGHIDPIFLHFLMFRDRKSTRLNSSHVKISYAVFCLKKK